ncbi:diacylglycerol kinase family protein [Paenibacillus lautus]|uniref:diacylglycerol kinase family protein n=1 Tax=Paenibacillus lautus TaxID=1401 RepID=UPI002DB94D59|nr:diacylglycerol kinase family protein [Paenibacillus lautus]MEC0202573.1 diacylglycerol kinase family protein [Paenibacillus lautus]MEC0255421.1 diacylglycerol kinase family protein [Paenibacillus lautus]MEC0306189.1 diacylglycerol kinase family protein [Paenibacillus lautus]
MKPHRQSLYRAFGCAIRGILTAVQTERNMKIHIAAALIVFIAAALLQLDRVSWLFLVLAIALVFIAELVNTAVEAIIDLISPEEHVLARVAKDTAAGAALVAAVFAVVIGILVFYEPVWEWIQSMTS